MAATKSIYNTPNTFGIYCLQKITEKLLKNGGMPATAKRAAMRSGWMYDAIDASGGFYTNPIPLDQRSHTAIPFHVRGGDPELEARFINTATEAGLLQVFGHASIGGLRICVYNGIADESVKAIVSFMAQFKAAVEGAGK
jgi:phosphoserine aminotransferase